MLYIGHGCVTTSKIHMTKKFFQKQSYTESFKNWKRLAKDRLPCTKGESFQNKSSHEIISNSINGQADQFYGNFCISITSSFLNLFRIIIGQARDHFSLLYAAKQHETYHEIIKNRNWKQYITKKLKPQDHILRDLYWHCVNQKGRKGGNDNYTRRDFYDGNIISGPPEQPNVNRATFTLCW